MAPVHPGKTIEPMLMGMSQKRRTKFAKAANVINNVANTRVALSDMILFGLFDFQLLFIAE